eukprot:6409282-Amphidinium_carterae.1
MACANVLNAVVLQLGPATPWRDVAVKRIALCAGRCICFRRSSSWCPREKTCSECRIAEWSFWWCRNMFHGGVKGRLAANHLGSGDGCTDGFGRVVFRVFSRALLRDVRAFWVVSRAVLRAVSRGCRTQRKSCLPFFLVGFRVLSMPVLTVLGA